MPVKPKSAAAKPAVTKSEDDDFETEDEDEYFPPSKSKAKAKAPAPSKSRARDEDEDDDDDDEDDEDLDELEGGWGAYKRNKAETSNFPNSLKLEEDADPVLVRFLEDEPLVSFKQHWIERKGKKSFTCIAPKQDCPLCAVGEDVRAQNVFNVLVFDKDGSDPVNMTLTCGTKLSDILVSKTKKVTLSSRYWGLARTGKGGSTNYDVTIVKERDLKEDWDVEPLDADALEALVAKKWSKEAAVNRQSRKELLGIAKELVGDYDSDDDDDE
jgi:hypothetical protein